MTGTALVLGAGGHFGRHAAQALAAAGWEIRRFDRSQRDMAGAAGGADLIVNGLNPPGYRDWARAIPAITDMVIRAALASGATVLVPGNVYPFGTAPAPWGAGTTPVAPTEKGRIRIAMEAAYRRAADEGLRTILLRAGDFIDSDHAGSWFGMIVARAGQGVVRYPGPADVTHAWAWLPDMGRAAAMLADRRASLPAYADIAFPGLALSGAGLAATIGRALGRDMRLRRLPLWPFRLLAPFSPLFGGIHELRHLWTHPHWLEGDTLARLLPDFRPTPVEQAMAEAIGPARPKG
jgi:nucleoside-diphosphate-sugar epimerase